MSKGEEKHPSNRWYQPKLWGEEEDKVYRSYRKPYDQDKSHDHEIAIIKDMVRAIMNTLDEIKGYIDDQAEILDDIVYVLYKDEE